MSGIEVDIKVSERTLGGLPVDGGVVLGAGHYFPPNRDLSNPQALQLRLHEVLQAFGRMFETVLNARRSRRGEPPVRIRLSGRVDVEVVQTGTDYDQNRSNDKT